MSARRKRKRFFLRRSAMNWRNTSCKSKPNAKGSSHRVESTPTPPAARCGARSGRTTPAGNVRLSPGCCRTESARQAWWDRGRRRPRLPCRRTAELIACPLNRRPLAPAHVWESLGHKSRQIAEHFRAAEPPKPPIGLVQTALGRLRGKRYRRRQPTQKVCLIAVRVSLKECGTRRESPDWGTSPGHRLNHGSNSSGRSGPQSGK